MKPSEAFVKRKKYLVRISSYYLVEASLPVFIAAGISNAVGSIISSISEEDLNAEIIQFSVYASVLYFVGKYITYLLYKDEDSNSSHWLCQFIQRYKLSKLFRHVIAENSGFAWKEFITILAFNYAYVDFGWGPAFTTWILTTLLFVAGIYLSSYVQQKLCGVSAIMNERLLSFDGDAAALPIAYVLTVLLALGLKGLHASFVSESSYLYSWDEDYEDAQYGSSGYAYDLYILYATLVSFVVAAVLALETSSETHDVYGTGTPNNDINITSVSGSHKAQPSTSFNSLDVETEGAGDQAVARHKHHPHQSDCFLLRDYLAAEACAELWHNFLGYFCGVAWFVLIVDNIKLGGLIPNLSGLMSSFLGVLLAALVLTWRGPGCMAGMKFKQESLERQIAAKRKARLVASASGSSAEASESTTGAGCVQSALNMCTNAYDFYLRVSHRRKDVMFVVMRLVIGWSWEIVVQQVFHLLGAFEHDDEAVETAVSCVLAVVIVLLSLGVHLYIRDWDADATAEESGKELDGSCVANTQLQGAPRSDVISDSDTRSPLSTNRNLL